MALLLGDLLQPVHIVVLLIVALLVFGPRRLPELGGAVGKTIKEFQRSMNEARSQVSSTPAADDPQAPIITTVASRSGSETN